MWKERFRGIKYVLKQSHTANKQQSQETDLAIFKEVIPSFPMRKLLTSLFPHRIIRPKCVASFYNFVQDNMYIACEDSQLFRFKLS